MRAGQSEDNHDRMSTAMEPETSNASPAGPDSRPRIALPVSLGEALRARCTMPGARFIAGGTRLLPLQSEGEPIPAGYVSLRRVQELKGLTISAEHVAIGAAITMAQLRRHPLIGELPLIDQATRSLTSRQIRERATVGGNLCSDTPYATLPPCLLALDAQVTLTSLSGSRDLPLADFLGQVPRLKDSGEILASVSWKRSVGFQGYSRIGRRNAFCYAVLSASVVFDQPRRTVRIALGGAGPTALRAHAAEELVTEALDWASGTAPAGLVEAAAAAVSQGCQPETDAVATATYRRHAAGVMVRRLLENALAQGGAS
ncbi:MAG: FAD binding domain-containing protein [Synechococcus sp.]|nr:FAD binding domain-containing protein [Synechococcus sp.]